MDRFRRRTSIQGKTPGAGRIAPNRATRLNRKLRGAWWTRLPAPRRVAGAVGLGARAAVPALVTLAAIGGAGAAAWGAYHFVTTSRHFAVESIDIHGTAHVDVDELRASLPVHLGENIFAVDTGELTAIIRKEPWVLSADVRRELPHQIVIDVRERTAVALVELGGLYLVDDTGTPFKRADLGTGDGQGLPTITGLDRATFVASPAIVATSVQQALAALRSWAAHPGRPTIGELHLAAGGELILRTYDDATAIRLGELSSPYLMTRMASFDVAWDHLSAAEKTHARAIHLDGQPDHVTVAFAKD